MNIDLSRLAPPTLLEVDFDALLNVRRMSLRARFEDAGLTFDVEKQETDPAILQQREDAFRQMLDLQSINDMALARTLGYAQGADLDWIAATFYADVPGIARMPGETDERYERRILLAGDALAGAITEAGLVYHALAFDTRIVDASAFRVAAGAVHLVLLVDDGAPADQLRAAVFSHLRQPKLRGTEGLTVSLAQVRRHRVSIRLQHAATLDAAPIKAAAQKALSTIKARVERAVGAKLTTDELIATGRVAGVSKLLLDAPQADIDAGRAGVLSLDIEVKTERMR